MSSKNESQETGKFSEVERAAMKERARELKAEARAKKKKADGESDVLEKISEMVEPDRTMATRLHALIKDAVPALMPRTWYGMPAYALDGKVICFFQSGQKFGTRYATLGFSDSAQLDNGDMWPTSYALCVLTSETEAQIVELVKRAAA